MKKILSLILSICMLMSVQFTTMASTQTAEEIILSVADAEWTLTDDLATYGISGADYGDASMGITAVGIKKADGTTDVSTPLSLEQLSDDIYVTYSKGIQKGAYKVMYYYPNFTTNTTYTTGRNASILDSDLVITDANGTHTVTSTKPDISYGGWVDIGTYEFSGDGNDSIKVYVNQDNKVVAGQWKKTFLSAKVKLIPQTTAYSELLSAVNSSESVGELKNATKTHGSDFLDINALKYMDDAYQTMLEQKPEQGFKSAYQFKNVFDRAVEAELEKVTVKSSSFVWQGSQGNVDSFGYRINWEPVELAAGGDSRAVVTFKVSNTQNIKEMKLKLNPYMTSVRFANNAVITKYSSDVIELPNSSREQNKFMNSATFAQLDSPIKVTASLKNVTDDAIIAATQKNGYISFYLIGDTVTYQGVTANNHYASNATLELVYDNTNNPNMSMTSSSVNNEAINTSKVFDLTGFSKIDSVAVNRVEIDSTKYSFNGSRLLIDASVFTESRAYAIEVREGSETRSVAMELVGEKIIYAQDSEKVTWSATPASNLHTSMTRPDETHLLMGVPNPTDTSVTYSQIPNGAYDVYMYYPKWLSTVSYYQGRTSGIYDNSAEITDSNGTYNIKSTKPSINYEGYTKIGTYEFSGNSNEKIKFFVNTDYSGIVASIGTRYFAHYAIKLIPVSNEGFVRYYYDNGSSFIDDLNNSENKSGFVQVINNIADYDNNFINTNTLYDMSGVYSTLYNLVSQTKFKTEYEFKSAFDEAVSDYVEIKEIPTSLVLSTYTDDGEILKVLYKKNSTTSLLYLDKSYASLTFDGVSELEPNAIIDAQLKMNTSIYADDYYLTKYSKYSPTIITSDSVADGNLDGNSEANLECNVFFEYFDSVDEELLTPFYVRIDADVVKEAAQEKLPLSYYIQLKNKITDYTNVNTFTGATLKISYDITYKKSVLEAAKEISAAETLEKAKELMTEYADIFDVTEESCDSYALALWNELIEIEEDVNNCINALSNDFNVNKNITILTDSEYIGGVAVKNFGTNETPVRIVAAAYDSTGKLIGMDYADRETNLSAGDAYVYAFAIYTPQPELVDRVKVFAWGDMIKLVPLANAVEHK